jgi:YjbE family integral membrane protein
MLDQFLSASALAALLQVLVIDLVLAGDNAVAVGLAAAGLPPEQRRRAIFWGLAAAVVTRIGFALVAGRLMGVMGLLLAGGLLLLWVSWKFWRELQAQATAQQEVVAEAALADDSPQAPRKSFRSALLQIVAADVSMSLDNVLAVAGAAREHPAVLALGLMLSILLMGVAAHTVARLLHRFRWIGYVGLAVVLYVSLHMIWVGGWDLMGDLAWIPADAPTLPQ